MNDKDIELFKSFLEKENVYSKFKKEVEKQNNLSLENYLKGRMSYGFGTLIMAAFDWVNTSEGIMYWKRLNESWIMYYKNNIDNKEE